ncbi:MAG: preprotein translocase subunit YajC [Candidatus Omnitrophota bacterium]
MPNQAVNPILNFLPLIFVLFIFYFLVFAPQQKQQKEHRRMIDGLKKNDEIVTAAGIHGTIVNVKDKTFIVRVDDNAKIEIDKSAVSYLIKKQES